MYRSRRWRRPPPRWIARTGACVALFLAATGGAEPLPDRAPFTLLDPSLQLPSFAELAPELATAPRLLVEVSPMPRATPEAVGGVDWQFRYQRSKLDTVSNRGLRSDQTTGFSRQLDRDVLELGMSWGVAGNRIGLGYELQAAREGLDQGFSRFLPGSANATHALTLGVTREFGRGAPPPPPVPLLGVEPPPPTSEPALR